MNHLRTWTNVETCVLVAPQVVLINAVKDVAKALGNLISTTKAAAGKPYDDPSMLQLKSSAKVNMQEDQFSTHDPYIDAYNVLSGH